MKSSLTIDVEGHPDKRTYESVRVLDELLDQIEVAATLFVTPDVVATCPKIVSKWFNGDHSVGLHIHPERLGGESVYLSEYSYAEVIDLLRDACRIFESNLGEQPTHFRAGRWEHSEAVLNALNSYGFKRDSSLVPDHPIESYYHGDVLEFPLTVYSDIVVEQIAKLWGTSRIPLWADWFLPKLTHIPIFYLITKIVINSDRSYVMTTFHDYDLLNETVRSRIREYIMFIANRTDPATIMEL